MKSYLKIFLCLGLTLIGAGIFGQEAKFYAETDADKIFLNSTVTITYKIENLNASNFTPPVFDWFDVVAGPSRSSSTTIINGKVTKSTAFSYTLLSKKAGQFELKPASIIVDGKEYQTKPVVVEVIERDDASIASAGDRDFLVRMELSDTVAYIGQQVVLDYVLYNKVEISNYKLLNEPNYDGFYKTTLNESPRGARREIINGQEYYKRVLKRIALYPQQTGNYTFGPVSVQIGIPEPGARRSFFFSQRVQYKNDIVPAQSLSVLSVPSGAPKSFSGGVGQFSMQATVNKNQVSTDDAILVEMEIKGDGDIRTVQAPTQTFGKHWEVYDPKLITENVTLEKGRRILYKKFEYLLVPKKPGKLELVPEFTFFDTKKDDFQTLRVRPILINATQGTRTVTSDNREVVKSIELTPLQEESSPYFYKETYFSSVLHYSIFFVGLLSIVGFVISKRRRDAINNMDPVLKRQMEARQVALDVLAKSQAHMKAGEDRLFYEEISRALYGFLNDKYQLSAATLSLQELLLGLNEEESVSNAQVEEIKGLLSTCQQAIYAGGGQEEVQDTYKRSMKLLTSLS